MKRNILNRICLNIRCLLVLTLITSMAVPTFAQAEDQIHFQITVRDYDKRLLTNQELGIRIRIVTKDSDVIFEEYQKIQSSSTGIASINIGSGSSQSGDLKEMGQYLRDDFLYIRTDIDPEGGKDYEIVSHNRISSMPLALNAKYVLQVPENDSIFTHSVAGSLNENMLEQWEYASREVHSLGDIVGGGVVFYVDSSGEKGLVVTPMDLVDGTVWMQSPEYVVGSGSFSDGQKNTEALVSSLGPGPYAAYYCDTLSLNNKNDWYLPSVDELSLLSDARYHVNRTLGESLQDGYEALVSEQYWSSTQRDPESSYASRLGNTTYFDKDTEMGVRGIRKFSGLYDVHNYQWLLLLGPEEELKSNGNVTVILEDEDGDALIDEAGKRGTVCRTTPEISLPAKITFKLQTEYKPEASEPPTILRGTGDFRICFGGPPKGETLEDLQESNMGEYEGVQFRIHPHLDKSPIRVYTGSESHTCTSIWLRYVDPDKLTDDDGNPITGLASDECQGRGSQCGWERVGLFEDGFGLENMEETLVSIIISDSIISITANGRTWSVDIDELIEEDNDIVGDALRFDRITYMSISHTNTSRGYRMIKISDLKVLPLDEKK